MLKGRKSKDEKEKKKKKLFMTLQVPFKMSSRIIPKKCELLHSTTLNHMDGKHSCGLRFLTNISVRTNWTYPFFFSFVRSVDVVIVIFVNSLCCYVVSFSAIHFSVSSSRSLILARNQAPNALKWNIWGQKKDGNLK